MTPIATVEREVYIASEGVRAPVVSQRRMGKGLRREEVMTYEFADDWHEGRRIRCSEDDGRTWSPYKITDAEWPMQKGFSKEQYPFAIAYDPAAGRTIQFVFQRVLIGKGDEAIRRYWKGETTFFDHGYWQVSDDDGRTWGPLGQFRYEEGPAFDEDDWGNSWFLRSNQMYGGYMAAVTREGAVVYPASSEMEYVGPDGERETVTGVRCFIGKWDAAGKTYRWEVSAPVAVSHRVSGRGLLEPAVVELTDGRLLMDMRGSTDLAPGCAWKGKVECAGRRWVSLSSDGGRTWSAVTDLRYDNGEQFYSPGTLARFHRHSRNGKLYWVGNIASELPAGNGPRYPLQIAEVDESIPAIRKDTVTVIDDRRPTDTPNLQLSNFSIVENCATGQLEMFLTRYAESSEHWLHANAYKYTLTLI